MQTTLEAPGAYGGITETRPNKTDDEILRRYLCFHFPNKVLETMKRYVNQPSYVDVLTRIIGPNVKCMQSMLFVKASGKPGQLDKKRPAEDKTAKAR